MRNFWIIGLFLFAVLLLGLGVADVAPVLAFVSIAFFIAAGGLTIIAAMRWFEREEHEHVVEGVLPPRPGLPSDRDAAYDPTRLATRIGSRTGNPPRDE
jgi:hypothetical protein